MQIFKRVSTMCLKRAQNLVEFVFVLPILIFMTLAIFETALFWQDVNAVYNLNAEINANVALVSSNGMSIGTRCTAANRAIEVLKKRDSMISLSGPTNYNDAAAINDPSLVLYGKEPFALYTFVSSSKINGTSTPQISLWVDCRSPFENGITTQIQFYHKTMITKKVAVPNLSTGGTIVIIPENIFIASPKLNTIKQY